MESTYAYEIVYYDSRDKLKRDVHVAISEISFEDAFRRAVEHAKIAGFVLKEVRYIGSFI